MSSIARDIIESTRAKILSPKREETPREAWSRATLSGRLAEISNGEFPSALTAAFGLVLDAQRQGEPVAWITPEASCFFPPDAAEGGVDLCSLVVVRTPSSTRALRAADKLIRSGAFGLVVLDMTPTLALPRSGESWLARLLGLARKHDTAVVLLTEKRGEAPSLSSLVSLRGESRRSPSPLSDGHGGEGPGVRLAREACLTVEIRVLKDKRRAPGWTHAEQCRGPAGLR
ncbi:MAG: recombinase A [Deltaproteobacteria bacterium]|nr:recombinase A [Deltaproteobacteria bacterium]